MTFRARMGTAVVWALLLWSSPSWAVVLLEKWDDEGFVLVEVADGRVVAERSLGLQTSRGFLGTFDARNVYLASRSYARLGGKSLSSPRVMRLRLGDMDDKNVEVVGLDFEPTALSARNGELYVGGPTVIDVVNFDPPARRRLLDGRDERGRGKAVDAFAWTGHTLAAVDDVVRPKYAFVMDLPPGGKARYLFTQSLNTAGPNATYFDAAARDGTLAALFDYGVRTGSGQGLMFAPLAETPRSHPEFMGEFGQTIREAQTKPRRPGTGAKWGREFANTDWTAVHLPHADTAWICAGGRGVMVVPLTPTTAVHTPLANVECLDMTVMNGQVWALLRNAAARRFEIARIVGDQYAPQVATRLPLRSTVLRFARGQGRRLGRALPPGRAFRVGWSGSGLSEFKATLRDYSSGDDLGRGDAGRLWDRRGPIPNGSVRVDTVGGVNVTVQVVMPLKEGEPRAPRGLYAVFD
jgi:hypothetical protein